MNSHSKADPLHREARKGINLFNLGEFYEAHEPLELAWMKTRSPERDLYQGILQIGLAYFQISKNNYRGAIKMFNRGQRNLKPLGDTLLGINICQLRNEAKVVEETIRQLGPYRLLELDRGLLKEIPFLE